MGYKNEGASLNKYSSMKEYCDKHITKALTAVYVSSNKKEEEIKALKPKFEYRTKEKENLVPVIAIDGGMATIFSGAVEETKILKVASGYPPEFEHFFLKPYEDFIHVFTGQLKWPEGVDKTVEELSEELIEELLKNETIKKARYILNLEDKSFADAMRSRINHLKGGRPFLKGFEDNVREVFELSAMVILTQSQLDNELIMNNFSKESLMIPYLLIKDGTLYPSKMTASSLFAEAVAGWFNRGDVFVVGVVKASRFVNKENSWAKTIHEYAENVPSHTFFRLPDKVEMSIDPHSKDQDFKRYFLSIFGGEGIYEIQIPRVLSNDDLKVKAILDVIASQITFRYGGSISTNSHAHENASLPEAEAKYLTQEIKEDLTVLLKKHNQEKKDEKP